MNVIKCTNCDNPSNLHGYKHEDFCSRKCQIETTGKQNCNSCKSIKDISEFYKKTRNPTGYGTKCKNCKRIEKKLLRNKNRLENKPVKKYTKTLKQKYAYSHKTSENKMLDYLLEHPCVDCGETDVNVLEFDHIDHKTKAFSISEKWKNISWDRIMKEIEKCEVRCANCHSIRTSKQFNWYEGIDIDKLKEEVNKENYMIYCKPTVFEIKIID